MVNEGTDVVPLSRWRALVARSRSPARRVEALLADPAAATLVPELPAEDFYYLVKAVGLEDAGDLLRLAAPEQVQTCLDLDAWRGDTIAEDRLVAWLEAISELPARRLAALVRELDDEVLATLLVRHLVIYDLSLGERPDPASAAPTGDTPDGFFRIALASPEGDKTRVIERFVDRLYRADSPLATSLLQAAKWGLPSALEEQAYRWRSNRLADLGFVEYHEARAVYRWLDPRGVPAGAPSPAPAAVPPDSLPMPFAEPLAEDTFLGRVLAAIEDGTLLGAVSAALVALLNRVLSADRIDPADAERVREATARARDTLSLGLEFLAGGSVERAIAVLCGMDLVRVFRVGHSLGLDLGRAARALQRDDVVDPTLDALLAPRPEYPCALDEQPRAGTRPFRTVADLGRVESYLSGLRATTDAR